MRTTRHRATARLALKNGCLRAFLHRHPHILRRIAPPAIANYIQLRNLLVVKLDPATDCIVFSPEHRSMCAHPIKATRALRIIAAYSKLLVDRSRLRRIRRPVTAILKECLKHGKPNNIVLCEIESLARLLLASRDCAGAVHKRAVGLLCDATRERIAALLREQIYDTVLSKLMIGGE
jgi:hypothetical protein